MARKRKSFSMYIVSYFTQRGHVGLGYQHLSIIFHFSFQGASNILSTKSGPFFTGFESFSIMSVIFLEVLA